MTSNLSSCLWTDNSLSASNGFDYRLPAIYSSVITNNSPQPATTDREIRPNFTPYVFAQCCHKAGIMSGPTLSPFPKYLQCLVCVHVFSRSSAQRSFSLCISVPVAAVISSQFLLESESRTIFQLIMASTMLIGCFQWWSVFNALSYN